MSRVGGSDTMQGNFKDFSEKLLCSVFPITHDKRVYLVEKVVDDDEHCVVIGNNHYDLGETYYDALFVEADGIADMSDAIVQGLYAHGFSSRQFEIVRQSRISLQYSFLNDDPWIARRKLDIVVHGDITDEDDYRRSASHRGRWFAYSEIDGLLGEDRAHKLLEGLADV